MEKNLFRTLALLCLLAAGVACTKNNDTKNDQVNLPPAEQTAESGAAYTRVSAFIGQQVTGVTAAEDGRLFANFPRWRDGVANSVVEILADGTLKAYPDASWNEWTGTPQENKFTCVQSVVAAGTSLFVLDPANPIMMGVVGRPTLYEFDLKTNALLNKWSFDETVAPPRSYLNDLRVDPDGRHIYITESGIGAIVVLDRTTGKSRRLLDQHPSTKSEPVTLVVDGKPVTKPSGLPQRFQADGIALHDDYLYYHVVTGYHLYRVPVAALKNESAAGIGALVEDLGKTPAPDGMIFDKNGNLYMADLEHNAVVYRTPAGEIKTLVQDPDIHWADTFTIDRDQNLIFTDSHIAEVGIGRPAGNQTFEIYKIALPK